MNTTETTTDIKAYLHEFYRPLTAKKYHADILAYLGNCPGAAKFMYKDIARYVGVLRERYTNSASLRAIVCAIKVYYAYLCHAGLREDNPASMLRLKDKAKNQIQLQDLFTTEELGTMLQREGCYPRYYSRNKVLMSLLIYQALWPQELAALQVQDIDLTAATIYVRATARSEPRTLQLQASQVLLFYEYINKDRTGLIRPGTTTQNLLIGLQGRPLPPWAVAVHIKRLYRSKYPGRIISPGTIRQSVITNLLKAGHDISVVRLFAGHVCAGSTQRYQQSDVDTLKTAIDKYHPFKPS